MRPSFAHAGALSIPLLLLTASGLGSCNRHGDAGDSETTAVPAPPGKTGTARISGSIVFHGAVPAPGLRRTTADCARLAGPPPPQLVLSSAGGVKDAFVYVQSGLPPGVYPVPSEPVTLDQKGCEYAPRVLGVRADQPIVLANSDPILHNVHAPGFNVPLPNAGVRVTRKISKPQVMAVVTCDVHPWMRAFAGVMAHPFFAVTGADGSFALQGLPAGSYTVGVWHERLGQKSQAVTVADGESKTVTLDMNVN